MPSGSRAIASDKPTVLLMIDRNELEDQVLKNLAALGLGNLEHASSIRRLNELLKIDYRGIIVTMIHKFRGMPADLNLRKNIYVLIDEAHRTTGGDLGTSRSNFDPAIRSVTSRPVGGIS